MGLVTDKAAATGASDSLSGLIRLRRTQNFALSMEDMDGLPGD